MSDFYECVWCDEPRLKWAQYCQTCLDKVNGKSSSKEAVSEKTTPKIEPEATSPETPTKPTVMSLEELNVYAEALYSAFSRERNALVDRVVKLEETKTVNDLGPIVCSRTVILEPGQTESVEIKSCNHEKLMMKGLAVFGDSEDVYVRRATCMGMNAIIEGYEEEHAVPAVAFRIPLRVIPLDFDYYHGLYIEVSNRGAQTRALDITLYCGLPFSR